MGAEKSLNQDQKIKSALVAKWPKITTPEVTEIMSRHEKLTDVLKQRYSMAPDKAAKECETFFKPYTAKQGPVGLKKGIK